MDSLEHITSTIRQVAIENKAAKAILFGSHARGTPTAQSDVDVVFVEITRERFLERIDKYLSKLTDRLSTAVEVLVYTPEEYAGMQGTPFMKCVMSEGIVVYEH